MSPPSTRGVCQPPRCLAVLIFCRGANPSCFSLSPPPERGSTRAEAVGFLYAGARALTRRPCGRAGGAHRALPGEGAGQAGQRVERLRNGGVEVRSQLSHTAGAAAYLRSPAHPQPPARPAHPREGLPATPRPRHRTTPTYLRVAANAGFRQAPREHDPALRSGAAHWLRPVSISLSANGKRQPFGGGPGAGADRWRCLWAPRWPGLAVARRSPSASGRGTARAGFPAARALS